MRQYYASDKKKREETKRRKKEEKRLRRLSNASAKEAEKNASPNDTSAPKDSTETS